MLHPASGSWGMRQSLGAHLICPACSWEEGSPDVLARRCSKHGGKQQRKEEGNTLSDCLKHGQNSTFCPCSVLSSGELMFAMTMQQWDSEPAKGNAKPPVYGDPHKTAMGQLGHPD